MTVDTADLKEETQVPKSERDTRMKNDRLVSLSGVWIGNGGIIVLVGEEILR